VPGPKEIAMSASRRAGFPTAANVDDMMERLGIDQGCRVDPHFGLTLCCVLRTCRACTARETCVAWLARHPEPLFGPPDFCPNVDLLWELVCDRAVGRRTPAAS
jgi:Family of unknown function (DUF6455)